jgi:hypothetical protein
LKNGIEVWKIGWEKQMAKSDEKTSAFPRDIEPAILLNCKLTADHTILN